MNKNYLNDFLAAACASNDDKKARIALELGLNKEEGFTFNNPRTFMAFTQARDINIPLLMIEFGYNKDLMLKICQEQKIDFVAKAVSELIEAEQIKKEKVLLDGTLIQKPDSKADKTFKV